MTTPTTETAAGADASTSIDSDVTLQDDSTNTGKKVDAIQVVRDDGSGSGTNETVLRQVVSLGGTDNTARMEVSATKPARDAPAALVRVVDLFQVLKALDRLAEQNERVIQLLKVLADDGEM